MQYYTLNQIFILIQPYIFVNQLSNESYFEEIDLTTFF